MDWFRNDNGLRHERVNCTLPSAFFVKTIFFLTFEEFNLLCENMDILFPNTLFRNIYVKQWRQVKHQYMDNLG